MLPWTLPLHYSLSARAYWEGPQNDDWNFVKFKVGEKKKAMTTEDTVYEKLTRFL